MSDWMVCGWCGCGMLLLVLGSIFALFLPVIILLVVPFPCMHEGEERSK